MAARRNRFTTPELEQFVVTNVHLTGLTLGTGSYGSVEEAEISLPGSKVAAKKLHHQLVNLDSPQQDQLWVNKFVDECKLMSRLRHPHIVKFLGICYLPGSPIPVLLMEKLQNSLDNLLETSPNIPLEVKVHLLTGTIRGVVYLHDHASPIVHRDLTARNILIDSELTAKIADLGVARMVNIQPGQLAATMTAGPGNALYMPPEAAVQDVGTIRYNTAIDIFSFGVVSLFTFTQTFPKDLKLASYFDTRTRTIKGRTEIERREEYVQQMKTALGETHALVKLTLDCLEFLSEDRPSAVEVLRQLEVVGQTIPQHCRETKLELIRQIARNADLAIRNEEELRQRQVEHQRQLIEKDAEIRQLQLQLTQKNIEIDKIRKEYEAKVITLEKQHQLTSSQLQAQVKKSGSEAGALPDSRKFQVDHSAQSTQHEDPRLVKSKKQLQAAGVVPYSGIYKQKYEYLIKHLAAKKPDNLPRVFEIPVRRKHLFEDSHRAIMSCKNLDHLKTRLWVKFTGEQGLDYGGVSREWFFLLSHEIFNPYYGLFKYLASDNHMLQVNPDSGLCNENHLDYFRFTGRILAMAVYHKRLIDVSCIRPFYKMLLDKRITLDDLEAVDTEFYHSVRYILDNDPKDLCLTFSTSREFAGQVEAVELKPGGSEIEVTQSNKKEYVNLLIKWSFEDRISEQMEALKKGFNDIFPIKMLYAFNEQEIEYLLCGLTEVDVNDWRKHTVYAAGYTPTDDVIVWFWKIVENFDNELRGRLLQFVRGTSRVPMNGFAELHGSNGRQKFCIKKRGEPTSLPMAHTNFNRIDLPPYHSYQEVEEKLRFVIENTVGFDGVVRE